MLPFAAFSWAQLPRQLLDEGACAQKNVFKFKSTQLHYEISLWAARVPSDSGSVLLTFCWVFTCTLQMEYTTVKVFFNSLKDQYEMVPCSALAMPLVSWARMH